MCTFSQRSTQEVTHCVFAVPWELLQAQQWALPDIPQMANHLSYPTSIVLAQQPHALKAEPCLLEQTGYKQQDME